MYDLRGKRVWVAGHRGMVGRALVRRLAAEDCEILAVDRGALDLTDQAAVRRWVAKEQPSAVFLAAAKVGGILANDTLPADFLYENLMIEANVLEAAYRSGVEKLCFLGSSCIYPRDADQPIQEESLLTKPLERTNESYAIAKIAGIKLAEAYRAQHGCDFISAMPCNLYGPGDNFDLQSSHVLPALIRKADDAKRQGLDGITIWGTGTPRREFIHVDDCADACVHLMKNYSGAQHVNVGFGEDISILELAEMICDIVGVSASVTTDEGRPEDGTPRKLLSVARMRALGWSAKIGLRAGIEETYAWYLANARDGAR